MVAVPLLSETARRQLQRQAETLPYALKAGTVGKVGSLIHEEYGVYDAFAANSLFADLKAATQSLLDRQLAKIDPYPFTSPLQFNAMVLQRYQPGQLGITPHRDRLSAINLICIYNLAGRDSFITVPIARVRRR